MENPDFSIKMWETNKHFPKENPKQNKKQALFKE